MLKDKLSSGSKLNSHFLALDGARHSEVHALHSLIHELFDVLPVFPEEIQYRSTVLYCPTPLEGSVVQGH
jgi:hypothetical protein